MHHTTRHTAAYILPASICALRARALQVASRHAQSRKNTTHGKGKGRKKGSHTTLRIAIIYAHSTVYATCYKCFGPRRRVTECAARPRKTLLLPPLSLLLPPPSQQMPLTSGPPEFPNPLLQAPRPPNDVQLVFAYVTVASTGRSCVLQ